MSEHGSYSSFDDSADAPRDRSRALGGLAGSAVATASVFALVGGLIAAFGQDAPDRADRASALRGAVPQQRSETAPASPTQPGASRPAPGPSAATPAAPNPVPTTGKPPAAGQPDSSVPVSGVRGLVPKGRVVVFNQTHHRGLAQRVAADLTRAGWQVVHVGNWIGNVRQTTVYAPHAMNDLALALMDDFPVLGRKRSAVVDTDFRRDALTIILAKDYPLNQAG